MVQGSGANASIKAAEIVASINSSGSSVQISADKIYLNGETIATYINTEIASIDNIAGDLNIVGALTVGGSVGCGSVSVESWSGFEIDGSSAGLGTAIASFGAATASGGQITIPTETLSGASGPDITFNIADTQYYQSGVSAAETAGWNAARAKVDPPGSGTGTTFDVGVPSATQGQQQTYTFTIQKGATPASTGYASVALSGVVVGRIEIGSWYDAGAASVGFDDLGTWSNGSRTITLTNGVTDTVSIPATGSWSSSKPNTNRYGYTCTVGGRSLYNYADLTNWDIYGNASGTTVSFKIGDQTYTHTFSNYP